MEVLSNISTLQNNKYKVETLLGTGGFGNTYLATHAVLGRKVAIKEFFMKEYCDRDQTTSQVIVHTDSSRQIVERYKQKFLKEAQMIASIKNEHIIQIHDIFEENGTAYYVMEYVDGGSLKDKVESEGAMTEAAAIDYIRQISDALSYLHKHSILHLDIKPANILVDKDNKAILIDFGISKHYDSDGGQTSSTPAGVSKGYAPIEQYQQGSISGFSPSTDIYSLGATLYFLLTGETPPEASIIYEDGLPTIVSTFSKTIQNVVTTSMSPRRKDRFQSMEELLRALPDNPDLATDGGHTGSKVLTEETTSIVQQSVNNVSSANNEIPQHNKAKSNGLIKLIVAFVVVGLLVLSGVLINKSNRMVSPESIDYSKSKILFDDQKNLKSITFDASGQKSQTLTITKNFSENVTFTNTPDWVNVTFSNNSIKVKCDENPGILREARVYLHRKGDGGQYASAQIKIKQEAKQSVYPKPVISTVRAVLKVSETLQLSVKNARGQTTWTTSNSSVAVVSANGLVTSKQKGIAIITANVDGSELRCSIEVQEPINTNSTQANNNSYSSNKPVEISRESASMSKGETLKLELYNAKIDFDWESSDTEVATVSNTGLVNAKSEGKVIIWAKYPGNYKKCEITVGPAGTRTTQSSTNTSSRKVELSKSSATLKKGNTLKLYLYNATGNFEWDSTDPSVATVSSEGLVTAKSPGKTIIWAKYPGEFRKCEITVIGY